MKRLLALLLLTPAPVWALGAAFGGNPNSIAPLSTMNIYMGYGASLETSHQSSGSNICGGNVLTPAGAGQFNTTLAQSPLQQWMMNNVGAPWIGAASSFQPSQVTALLNSTDCGPIGFTGSRQSGGQIYVPTVINYLQTQDAGQGRGTVNRLAVVSGVGGRTITELSQPTGGEPCTDMGNGPQCYCYTNGDPNKASGTNGARCIFPFNQAFVGSTSMLGSACAIVTALGATCVVKALEYAQGDADTNTSQSDWSTGITNFVSNANAAIKATTGQSQNVEFVLQETPSHIGDSIVGPWKAQLAWCHANLGSHGHCSGPTYPYRPLGPTNFTITTGVKAGDSGFITFHVNGSDVTINATAPDGSLADFFAAAATAVNSNSTLVSNCMYALSNGLGTGEMNVFQRTDPGCPFPYTVTAVGTTSGPFIWQYRYPVVDGHPTNWYKTLNGEHIGRCMEDILESHECPYLEATAAKSGNSVVFTYNMSLAPRLTLPLVLDPTLLPQATNYGYSFEIGAEFATQASGGTNTIFFGGTPYPYMTVGLYVTDRTCPSCIPAGTTETGTNVGNGNITVSNPVTVANGDQIVFEDCANPPSFTGTPVISSNTITYATTASPANCTVSYGWSTALGEHNGGPTDSFGGTQETGYYGSWGNVRDSFSAVGAYSGFTDHNWAMNQQWGPL